MFNPSSKKAKEKKKELVEKKFSTVYSESESDWNSSDSKNDNSKFKISKDNSKANDRELGNIMSNKISGFDTTRTSQFNNRKMTLIQNNLCNSIYSDDKAKLKKEIMQMLQSKILKFKVNRENKVCREKLNICKVMLQKLEENNLDNNVINNLTLFQVEFSNINKLIQKYMRSMEINLESSVRERHISNIKSINILIPEEKSRKKKKKIVDKKQENCSKLKSINQKIKRDQNLSLFFKNNAKEKNKYKESICFDFVGQSRQIASWLESKIQTARNISPINTFRQSAFSPLNSGNMSYRKYRNPLSSQRSRNASLNSSKISLNSKPVSRNNKSLRKRQTERVFSPNPSQMRNNKRLLIRSFD